MKKRLVCVFLGLAVILCMIPFFAGCAQGTIVYAFGEDEEGNQFYYVYASRSNISDETFNGICQYYSEETGPVNEPLEGTLPVTRIANNGFMGCTKLKNIVIPDFITGIGRSAFAYCLSLESVTLHNGLKSVPYGIFGGDNSLFYVDIPESVERIESYAFYASYLREVTIPSSVEYMGEGVFYRCEYLKSVEIYAPIEYIPYCTFCSCTSLQNVTVPETVTEIKGYEFLNGDKEVISEDDIIHYVYGADNDTEDPNYEDNVTETVPAFYYTYLEAGSDTITFDYELEEFRFLGSEEELNRIVVGEYNVCLTESSVLKVFCMEDGEWKEVTWNF